MYEDWQWFLLSKWRVMGYLSILQGNKFTMTLIKDIFIFLFRLTSTPKTMEASLAWDIMSVVRELLILIQWFSPVETPSTVATEQTEIPLLIGTVGMMLSHPPLWTWTNCKDQIDIFKLHCLNFNDIGLCSGGRIPCAPTKPTSTLRWLAILLSFLEKMKISENVNILQNIQNLRTKS